MRYNGRINRLADCRLCAIHRWAAHASLELPFNSAFNHHLSSGQNAMKLKALQTSLTHTLVNRAKRNDQPAIVVCSDSREGGDPGGETDQVKHGLSPPRRVPSRRPRGPPRRGGDPIRARPQDRAGGVHAIRRGGARPGRLPRGPGHGADGSRGGGHRRGGR